MHSAIISFFTPNKNSDFLRSRNLFFVVALTLNLIWTLVAALDVSSEDTRQSSQHVAISAFNLAVQLISFVSIALIAILDSLEGVNQTWWFSHIGFDIAWFSFLTLLQFVVAITFTALVPSFKCESITCKDFNSATVVGAWLITILFTIFTIWFSITAIIVGKRDPSVWRERARTFDWEAASKPPLIVPSLPLGIGGDNEKASRTRKTWTPPRRPRQRENSVASHLPIQRIPPPTPKAPVPALPAEYASRPKQQQSIPQNVVRERDSFKPLTLDTKTRNLTGPWVTSPPRAKIGGLQLHRPSPSLDRSQIGLPRPLGTSNGFANDVAQGKGRWLTSDADVPPTPPPKSPTMSSTSSHASRDKRRNGRPGHGYQLSLDGTYPRYL